MTIIKCKMCGGELNILPNSTICECEYCGSKQTIPNTDDEKRLKLYERANKLRFENEFDKAAGVYESIVAEYQDEAEAYWGLVLCKYGIEYVDDPKTGKKIPTCHRSSFDSVMDDSNFDLVMENSDTVARGIYREEAKQIEELRKGIVEVSSKEEPYDIFICYKETADDGQRTVDSVIAQDIYQELTDKGYRVFFSRITLEDKLGQKYEPYIFAALNSAKVMLVFGTCYDYYNAVWVKNEWSRFLQLIEAGQKKTLIPCFKDIDAYDIPKEFAKLQAQDMGKIGAIQDLIRGIDKIFGRDKKVVENANVSNRDNNTLEGNNPTVDSLLKRASIFLKEDEWEKANEYAERVLDIDPENANAYLVELFSKYEYVSFSLSPNCCDIIHDRLFEKAYIYSEGELREELERYKEQAEAVLAKKREKEERARKEREQRKKEKKEKERLERAAIEEANNRRRYDDAKEKMNNCQNEDDFRRVSYIFRDLVDYMDSSVMMEKCLALAENAKRDALYSDALLDFESSDIMVIANAKQKFELIKGWKDSAYKIEECDSKIEWIKKNELLKRKRLQKILYGLLGIILVIIVAAFTILSIMSKKKNEAKINEYKNQYENALNAYNSGNYDEAKNLFEELEDYNDSEEYLFRSRVAAAKKGDVITFGAFEQDNDTSNGEEPIEWIVIDTFNDKILVISRDVLIGMNMSGSDEFPTWKDCNVRKWLNDSFMSSSFTTEEKSWILETVVKNDNGGDTTDKVYVLNSEESYKYLPDKEFRVADATEWAKANGGGFLDARVSKGDSKHSYWWLRSQRYRKTDDDYVFLGRDSNGETHIQGFSGDNGLGVRPVMWLKRKED